MKLSLLQIFALSLALAACGDPGASPTSRKRSEGMAVSQTIPPQITTPAASEPLTPPIPGTAAKTHPDKSGRLAIDGDGLRVFDPVSGASRSLPFGTSRAGIDKALTQVLGVTTGEGVNADCGGATYVGWPTGLSTWFKSGRLVGWSLSERSGKDAPKTVAGQGIGTTRADFEAASVMDVRTTSLGVEFTSGDIGGLLTSRLPDGRVTALWAGQTCIAR